MVLLTRKFVFDDVELYVKISYYSRKRFITRILIWVFQIYFTYENIFCAQKTISFKYFPYSKGDLRRRNIKTQKAKFVRPYELQYEKNIYSIH